MEKTTLPRILRPHLTIVNSGLYNFRFLEPSKKGKNDSITNQNKEIKVKKSQI